MKYVVLLGDGMADYPTSMLGGKTPLQCAFTPFLEIKRSVTHYSAKVPVLSKQYSVMGLYQYRNNSQY